MNKALIGLILAFLVSSCAYFDRGPKVVKVVERADSEIGDDGLVVSTKYVRAWVEDIERDGAAATLIKRFEEGQNVNSLALSPDGKTIVFSLVEKVDAAASAGGGGNFAATLRTVPTSGGGMAQLTTGRWLDIFPEYGPPGHITFASNRTRPDGLDIFRIDSERSGGVSMIRQTIEGFNTQPAVASDGTMVFTYLPDYRRRGMALSKSAAQIWSLGGKVDYPTQLREGSAGAISPDGNEIAFIGENGQIWTIGIDGRNPTQVTSSALAKDRLSGGRMPKRDPSWTGDGKQIIYSAADGKDSENYSNYDIWMIPRNGGASKQLTSNGSYDIGPKVSADGQWIYFLSNRGFTDGIWRIPFPTE